jgi:hypothetical protein
MGMLTFTLSILMSPQKVKILKGTSKRIIAIESKIESFSLNSEPLMFVKVRERITTVAYGKKLVG